MVGNTYQWVSTAYKPYPYNAKDGREDPNDTNAQRVTRGGAMSSPPEALSTTDRRANRYNPKFGHHNVGFRCAI